MSLVRSIYRFVLNDRGSLEFIPCSFVPGVTISGDGDAIRVEIDLTEVEGSADSLEFAEDTLRSHLAGHEFVDHREFEFSLQDHHREDSSGRMSVVLHPQSTVLSFRGQPVDIVVKDQDGRVVSDTRSDRFEKKRNLARLFSTYREVPEVDRLRRSYSSSIRDSDNELLHLYEIRDAIKNYFGTKQQALRILGVRNREWQRLGELANSLPLLQGRHRGEHASLRSASSEELSEARGIALRMLEAFIDHIDANSGESP